MSHFYCFNFSSFSFASEKYKVSDLNFVENIKLIDLVYETNALIRLKILYIFQFFKPFKGMGYLIENKLGAMSLSQNPIIWKINL